MNKILNTLYYYGLLAIIMSAFTLTSNAQNLNVPLDSRAAELMDKWTIQGFGQGLHNEIKPFQRNDLATLCQRVDSLGNSGDKADVKYAQLDNLEFSSPTIQQDSFRNRKPILKYFYKTPSEFLSVKTDHFYLKLNPILNFSAGKEEANTNNILENQRGLELRGGIDNKVYFYSQLLESQVSYVQYLTDRVNRFQAIMGNGFYKNYTSKPFKVTEGYDFNNANAYIGFNISKHIGAQFGYGKNFIGNGIRSLLLSDFANNYLYLKLNTQIGRFHYQNIFGELAAAGARDDIGDALIPKKYFAAHYLSYTFNKNWNAGFFETVVFSRKDHFEFQYLNPVILYRTVEGALGSPDNVLVGFNFSGNLFKSVQLYGQVMLDEFIFKELVTNNRGWWGNKYGLQGGIKYINALGIRNLDLQLEANLVTPYTYSHSDSLANYSHYNQALAHPLGANFIEMIGKFQYKISKLTLQCWVHAYKQGLNTSTENWGENILESNANRLMEYDNKLLQGAKTSVKRITLGADYEFYHNMKFFAEYTNRKQSGVITQNLNYIGAGLSVNFWWKPQLL